MKKKYLFIPAFVLFALLITSKSDGLNKTLTLNNITIINLSKNSTTKFTGGDIVRYNVNFSVSRPSIVFFKGNINFEGADTENLGLQFMSLRSGDYSIYWESTIPTGAKGSASITVDASSIPGLKEDTSVTFNIDTEQPQDAAFIGTDACILCHLPLNPDIIDAFQQSGHHFALSFVNGEPPIYPDFSSGVPNPPDTFDWQSLRYVIGGYAWNSFFVNQEGSILTTGVDGVMTQYNLPSSFLQTQGIFIPYEINNNKPLPFDCASCHTTGYSDEGHQDDLDQIKGTWLEDSIGCEACHGPGSRHRLDPYGVKLKPEAINSCVKCHIRDDIKVLEADDGLILHNQQYEELNSGGKSYFRCNSCHNPHASAHFNSSIAGNAIVQDCIVCHTDKTVTLGMEDHTCYDCHMPYAVKSGSSISFQDKDGNNLKFGDMRSHIFTINIEAESPSEMFSSDGNSVLLGTDGKTRGLTLDFVCQGCHRKGGSAQREYSYEEVKTFAPLIH